MIGEPEELEEIEDPVESWNMFIAYLQQAETVWSYHKNAMENWGARDLELLTEPKAQKYLSLALNKSSFAVALERLTDYWRRLGGLEELIIPVKEEKGGEEEE